MTGVDEVRSSPPLTSADDPGSSGLHRPSRSSDAESIIDSLGVGLVCVDSSWQVSRVNPAAEAVLKRRAADLVGRDLWQEFPGARELEFGRVYESVMTTRVPASLDAFYPGLGVWFELRVRPISDGIACYFLDITARKSAEQAVLAAADRSKLIADAMESLASSLDLGANLTGLARLVVPRLCRWAVVSVLDDANAVTSWAAWHADSGDGAGPAQRDVEAVAASQHAAADSALFGRVVSGGSAIVLDAGAHEHLRAAYAGIGPALDRLAPQALALLPMTARGRTIGVLGLYADTPWGQEQLDIARDVAARAALAVDNSLAYTRAEVARAEAEVAGQRLALLARVSEVLSDPTDLDAAVGQLARLVVPHLADWSLVTVVEDDGALRDVGFAHRDAVLEPILAEYSARRSRAMTDRAPRSTVLRRGEPLIVEHFSTDELAASQTDPRALAAARRLDPDGLATIPLTSNGRTFGVLTLVTTSERGPHTADEVAAALEIGRRAGPVLEVARAARNAQRLAESVQRSVLALAPAAPGLQVATRYRPANVDHEVGGDWYDTFTTPDGSTVITIGDVMGHDVVAIAAMAQLRTFMQACAWTLSHSPAEVLRVTDRAQFALGRPTFATAWTADLAPGSEGTVNMRWSNAGHLPGVLLHPDGSVELLRTTRVDPPLGVLAECRRHEHACTLEPGSVVVLYTDGLIERRDRDLEDGLTALLAAVTDLCRPDPSRPDPGRPDRGQLDLDVLLDQLLVRLTADGPGADDIALLAVRVEAPQRG